MDNLGNQQIVHAGWLIKSPPEKRIWKTKWRRRWFILKPSGQIPGQYLLEYYTDTTCKKLKGQIDLDQCEQVDAGLQLEIRKQNYDNMFDLRTSKRTYYLVAISEDDMNKWVECICSVCGLKMETLQNDLSLTLPSIEFNPNTDTTTTNNNNNGSQSSTNNSPNHNLNINANNTNSVSTNLESYEELRYSPQPIQNDPNQLLSSTLQQQQSTSELSLSTLNYIPISECYTGKPLCKDKNDDHRNYECLSLSSPPPPRPPKPALLQQHHQNINHLLTSASKSQSSLALWPHDQQHQQQTMATEQPTIMPNAIGNAPQLSSGSSLHQMSGSVLSAQQPSPPPKSSPSTVLLNNINNNNNANIVGNRSFYLNSSVSSSSKQPNENNQSYNFYDTWHSRSKRPDFLHAPSSSLQQQQPNILIPPHVNRDLKPNRRRILPEQQHSNSQENQKNLKQINYFQPKTNKSDSNVSMKMMIMNDTNYNHTDNNNNNNNLHQQYSANKQPFRRINTNSTQPNITSRHTLPRPLITSYTLRNNQNKDNYSHSTHCEQPKTTIEDCERQYLDLDLDIESTNSTNNNHNNLSTSPKTNDHHPSSSSTISDQNNIPDNQSDSLMNNNNNCDQSNSTHLTTDFADNPGTVYKEVDFLKTKALNEMRLNRNIYRKAN